MNKPASTAITTCLAIAALGTAAHAGQPLQTEDSAVLERGACEVEGRTLRFSGAAQRNTEDTLDDGLVRATTDNIGAGTISKYEPECINDNGFPGTRFAGNDEKSGREFNRQLINQRVVFYVEGCEHGCVYFHAIGGAAQVLAECVKKVRNVYFLEKFGSPEAIWELEVADFPVVVTMDSHGRSLHEEILSLSSAELARRL